MENLPVGHICWGASDIMPTPMVGEGWSSHCPWQYKQADELWNSLLTHTHTHTQTILKHSVHIITHPTPNLSPSEVGCWTPTTPHTKKRANSQLHKPVPHKRQWKLLLPYCPTAFPLHTLLLVYKRMAVCNLSSYIICMSEVHVLLLVNWKESKLDLNHLFSCP